jgi:pimeloyl-ACP methyl ester carboxylesterase
MLNPKSIPLVPLGITEIAKGNDSLLVKWALLFNDPNEFGAYAAAQSMSITCFEDLPRHEKNLEEIIFKHYPEFSALYTSGLDQAICNEFRPQVADKKIFQAITSNVPVLILAGELDPVCPPFFGQVTARTLSNSTFITVPSASHAAMFADDCLMKIATDFISSPHVKSNTECVGKRPEIKFVTNDLHTELNKLK